MTSEKERLRAADECAQIAAYLRVPDFTEYNHPTAYTSDLAWRALMALGFDLCRRPWPDIADAWDRASAALYAGEVS